MKKLDNFYFCRPESYFHEFGGHSFVKDEYYNMWLQVIKYVFNNYDLAEEYNGSFTFVPFGTPLVGVIDGKLQCIPYEEDDRLKPEFVDIVKAIHKRIRNGQGDEILPYCIDELYVLFNLKSVVDKYDPAKEKWVDSQGIINYMSAYTFKK